MTTTLTPTFTDIERNTLIHLWDREEEWWQFLYLLTDRLLEDGDDDGCRFVRWLCGWRRRGERNHGREGGRDGWFFWTNDSPQTVRSWSRTTRYGWLMPTVFMPICFGCHHPERTRIENIHDLPTGPVEAAMGHWRTLSEAEKVDLELNWRRQRP